MSTLPPKSQSETSRLIQLHFIEAMMSITGNLLGIGIFFFTSNQFHWGLRRNFMLSTCMGAIYVCGALAAHPLSKKFGRRTTLSVAYCTIGAFSLATYLFTRQPIVVCTILVYDFCAAVSWPIVESLVSSGTRDAEVLSRRISVYNIVWAAVGTGVLAVVGTIIEHVPRGVFGFSVAACFISAMISWFGKIEPRTASVEPLHGGPTPPPEPKLERQRVVALWLSRICVPAMYIVINALAAMLPSLAVIKTLRPSVQTLVSSVWFLMRWITFMILGVTAFWHTRPRLLLAAAMLLLLSYIAITIRPGELLPIANSQSRDLTIMILGQIGCGVALGMIYMASLYFGMVLSEGSTEQGGYHEALIGVGTTLGPAAGLLSQYQWPGDQHAAVIAVGSLVGLSILMASAASLRFSRKPK
ncbi:MAG TPA: MFS transporter [Tepidisphaeraceae bacterium]|nr:MFS transporter [Tepidisphaeraceae bacterium]